MDWLGGHARSPGGVGGVDCDCRVDDVCFCERHGISRRPGNAGRGDWARAARAARGLAEVPIAGVAPRGIRCTRRVDDRLVLADTSIGWVSALACDGAERILRAALRPPVRYDRVRAGFATAILGLHGGKKPAAQYLAWAAIAIFALYVTAVAAHATWWGTQPAVPGQLVATALPLLAIPIALAWKTSSSSTRAMMLTLLVTSLAITSIVVSVDHGRLRLERCRWTCAMAALAQPRRESRRRVAVVRRACVAGRPRLRRAARVRRRVAGDGRSHGSRQPLERPSAIGGVVVADWIVDSDSAARLVDYAFTGAGPLAVPSARPAGIGSPRLRGGRAAAAGSAPFKRGRSRSSFDRPGLTRARRRSSRSKTCRQASTNCVLVSRGCRRTAR